jgi:hypothetical protein
MLNVVPWEQGDQMSVGKIARIIAQTIFVKINT